MPDTRLPVRWLNDRRIQRLSSRAFKSFICSLIWSVANRTDGVIEPADLSLIPGFELGDELELCLSTLWLHVETGWCIDQFEATQTSKAEHEALEHARACGRVRQAKYRAKQAEQQRNATPNVTGDVTDDVSDVTGDVTGDATTGVTTQEGRQASPACSAKDIHTQATTPALPTEPGVALPSKKTARARATRLPQGWDPPRKVIEEMHERFPDLDLKTEHELFCNYWHAKSGQGATKVDWLLTWRNWIIKAAQQAPRQNGHNGHQLNGVDEKAAGWQSRKDRS